MRVEITNLRIRIAAVAVFAAVFLSLPLFFADARPKYMKRFNADPYVKAEYRNRCNVCHISRVGGGERTYFGDGFDESGRKITAELRHKYQQYFRSGN